MATFGKCQKLGTIVVFTFFMTGYLISYSRCDFISSDENLAYSQGATIDSMPFPHLTDGNRTTCGPVPNFDSMKIVLGGPEHIGSIIVLLPPTDDDAQTDYFKVYDTTDENSFHQCSESTGGGMIWADCGAWFDGVQIKFTTITEACEVIVSTENSDFVKQQSLQTATAPTTMAPTTMAPTTTAPTTTAPTTTAPTTTAPTTTAPTTMAPTTMAPTTMAPTTAAPTTTAPTTMAPTTAAPTTTTPTTMAPTTMAPTTAAPTTTAPTTPAPTPTTAHDGSQRSGQFRLEGVLSLNNNAAFTTGHGKSVVECAAACLNMELVVPCKAFKWMSDVFECRLYENVVLGGSVGNSGFFEVVE